MEINYLSILSNHKGPPHGLNGIAILNEIAQSSICKFVMGGEENKGQDSNEVSSAKQA